MAEQTKTEFRDFLTEEIIPELLASTGYTEEELMDEEVELEELNDPEVFNDEIMNNYQLVVGEERFDCFLDDELIEKFGSEPIKFKELLKGLE